MILPINHVADWRYICQRKQSQIEKYVIHENTNRINHNYRLVDKFMTRTKSEYTYETPFNVLYNSFQMWTKLTVTL